MGLTRTIHVRGDVDFLQMHICPGSCHCSVPKVGVLRSQSVVEDGADLGGHGFLPPPRGPRAEGRGARAEGRGPRGLARQQETAFSGSVVYRTGVA